MASLCLRWLPSRSPFLSIAFLSSEGRRLSHGKASAYRTRTSSAPGREGHVTASDARPTYAPRGDTTPSISHPTALNLTPDCLCRACKMRSLALRSAAPRLPRPHSKCARERRMSGDPSMSRGVLRTSRVPPWDDLQRAAAVQRNIAVLGEHANVMLDGNPPTHGVRARSSRCRQPRAVRARDEQRGACSEALRGAVLRAGGGVRAGQEFAANVGGTGGDLSHAHGMTIAERTHARKDKKQLRRSPSAALAAERHAAAQLKGCDRLRAVAPGGEPGADRARQDTFDPERPSP